MHIDSVKEKVKETMKENHGVEFAQQCPLIRNKTKATLYKNYGVTRTIDNPELRNKMNEYEYVNSKKVSKPQRKIAEYINGELNVYVADKFVDILLLEDKIVVEYNGSGHYISVLKNKITKEEFTKKEKADL